MRRQVAIAVVLGLSIAGCQGGNSASNVECAVYVEYQDEQWAEMGMYAVQGVCLNEGDSPARNLTATVQVCEFNNVLHEIPVAIAEIPVGGTYEIDLPFDSEILPYDVEGLAGLTAPLGTGCN